MRDKGLVSFPRELLVERPATTVLTPEQEVRIRALTDAFQEVYASSYEQSLHNFRCDMCPEREIVVWEGMATAYQSYIKDKELTFKQRKLVFEALLMRSSASTPKEILSKLANRGLTSTQLRSVMRLLPATSVRPLIIYGGPQPKKH